MEELDLNVAEKALASIEAQWNEAGARWDTEKLGNLFTHDALFFGSKPILFVGREVRRYYEAFPVRSCHFQFSEMKSVILHPTIVASCGVLMLSQVLSNAQKLDVRLRISLVIVKRGRDWKIFQHHVAPTGGFTAADLAPAGSSRA